MFDASAKHKNKNKKKPSVRPSDTQNVEPKNSAFSRSRSCAKERSGVLKQRERRAIHAHKQRGARTHVRTHARTHAQKRRDARPERQGKANTRELIAMRGRTRARAPSLRAGCARARNNVARRKACAGAPPARRSAAAARAHDKSENAPSECTRQETRRS